MSSLSRWVLAFLPATMMFALCTGCAAQLTGTDSVQSIAVRPALLRDVGLDQKLDAQVPLNLTFRDERGQNVALSQFFGSSPVLLTLVYYECPMLCTQVLNGLVTSMRSIPLQMGPDFTVVTVSIDPSERPPLASAKHELYAGMYDRPGAMQNWHFLTGDESHIKQLAASVGFRYAYDPATRQFAHPSGIMVLTPKGRVARYLYGISYPTRDLRLGLVEASHNKIGSPVDQILLYCYHYDPATGRYGLIISRLIQATGALTVLMIGALIVALMRFERHKTKVAGA